ncbi:MAG: hypothetical protein DPW21_00420 [Anaerolineae bacterium]|nr:hypothetical protein [Chloroflexi bacterium CFX2]MCQ3945146.1 hypothetical protein [Anaerolineae bacterium]MCZ7550919.1 ATP-binding protein [Anaerolineales bacterium]GER79172.1 conserved hypothetical protein [Candidatus Denitrolinea symbiosum]HPO84984.1 ATP-binding protein [Candidatus Hydrogenedentota bacterium]
MTPRPFIVLTGGPCGGKSTLMEELRHEGSFLFLPEAIFAVGGVGIPPSQKQFQRLMVRAQWGLEDALTQTLQLDDDGLVLCNRGSLDPLAYWLTRGWEEEEFFSFTRTHREEHYQRYAVVIHLVTAADGAAHAYKRYPEAHRPETVEESIRLDRLLGQVWQGHPRYYRMDNIGVTWEEKSSKAKQIIRGLM